MHLTNAGAITALAVACLGGCATKNNQIIAGSFIKANPAPDTQRIADEVAHKLTTLYPPARTRLRLQHAAPDRFGAAFVAALRTKGYELEDYRERPSTSKPTETGGLNLAYLIDQPLDSLAYRVTIKVGAQSLSRIYEAKAGTVSPAGYWVRKE